ncbi:sigma-70 family RNA polymerase sigma factor [Streptomyces sedi]|uniref:sigma-70 family RNA polymerase sigma factor n=1 Tax=Streptomyces sedi TaxID=555059 RepID=UPI001B8697F3|nr:sigma-70 family RNA polymerase sigma factor [Streptomyces sedi]
MHTQPSRPPAPRAAKAAARHQPPPAADHHPAAERRAAAERHPAVERPPAAERHRNRLLRYVNRLTGGDPHGAEDIVQETMLRAWLASDEFADDESRSRQDDDRLAAWLYVVARNLAVDARRRDRSTPTGITPAGLLQRATDTPDMAETVVNRIALTGALARLGPRHRDALVHVHLCDRSRDETARLLGIPQGTVKSRVHYALSTLRREFPAG